MTDTWQFGEYQVSTDKSRLNVDLIQAFLQTSYWAHSRSRAQLEKAIEGSLCFGVFHGDEQVGFARVISDYATFAYLADVFVLEAHRGKALGKHLVETILAHPPLAGCGWMLLTRDAHGLYRQYGFETPDDPNLLMRHPPQVPFEA